MLYFYRAFGHTVASQRPLGIPGGPASTPPDLNVVWADEPPVRFSALPDAPLYRSSFLTADGQPRGSLYNLAEWDLLRLPEVGNFYVSRRQIVCCVPRGMERTEMPLLEPVLTLWLERRGVPVLHASAVEVAGGRAVGFLGFSGAGKSTLAARFVAAGHALLSDDLLPVEPEEGGFRALPGYPEMRFAAAHPLHFLDSVQAPELIRHRGGKLRLPIGSETAGSEIPVPNGWGRFCATPRRLERLYVLQRGGADVGIEDLSPAESLIELLRCSFLARLLETTTMRAQRLEVLARLAEAVPVARLQVPEGQQHLPAVRAALLDDLAGRPARCTAT